MKLNTKDQESLVRLLARLCDEIFAIESEYNLMVSQSDLRPRIDYFHDAIRAYTTPKPTKAQQERLAIERLAYDVQALRYLSEKPLASLSKESGQMSPQTSMVKVAPSLVATAKKPDRDTKDRLSQAYQQYGMLFAALLKPTADRDYMDRTEALNEMVEQLHQEMEGLKPAGQAPIKKMIATCDKEIKTVDTAHHTYSTSQLAIYEASKDLLKKMAGSGMNIVGAFVEASIRSTKAGRGR